MEVKNLAWNENQNKRCNHPLLPKGIRGLIIGWMWKNYICQ